MTFDATLDIDHLLAEFLDNYYGGGAVRNENSICILASMLISQNNVNDLGSLPAIGK